MFPSFSIIVRSSIHILNHFDACRFFFSELSQLGLSRTLRWLRRPEMSDVDSLRNQIETVLMHCSGGTPSMYGLEELGVPRWSLWAHIIHGIS